ncbi:uncharacterized protein [Haliotis asinina]|uniref:uncharacterized protein n=1 Tax=Haliotis asinina TaxID=109174 RepID=UPI003531D01C
MASSSKNLKSCKEHAEVIRAKLIKEDWHSDCNKALNMFLSVCSELGVPIASGKTVKPCTQLTFLGIEVNRVQQVSLLPQDKTRAGVKLLCEFQQQRKVQLKDMQSLIGMLNFICRVIPMGRPFSRRLWDDNTRIQMYTDSAGGMGRGFGLYLSGRWAAGKWPVDWHRNGYTNDITLLEFFPIWLVVMIWGDHLRNSKVIFHSDNKAVVTILNKLSSSSPRVMVLVRSFTLQCLKLNLWIKGMYIPVKTNIITDCLSRSKFQQFHKLAPQADLEATRIPVSIWQHLKQKLSVC